MSSFLNQLISRNLNPTGAIQPRLASRFEPTAVAFTPIVEESEEAIAEPIPEATVEERSAPGSNPPEQTVSVPHTSAPNSISDSRIPTVDDTIFSKLSSVTQLNPDALSSIEQQTTAGSLPLETQDKRDETPQSRFVSSPLKNSVEPVVISEQKISQPMPQLGIVKDQSIEIVNQSKSVKATEGRSPNLLTPAQPQGLLEPPVVLPQPSSPISNQPTDSSLILERSPQPSAPTIQVRIGRVEVRAVMPSPPSRQPAQRAAPRLSLDEYLKSRKGGIS